MSWIQTFSNLAAYPLELEPSQVDIRDIAHSLALQCRFNGHVRVFHSVAHHSVLVSEHVCSEHRLWALLHDASEAYLSDMPSPIKELMPAYRTAEKKAMRVIAEKYGLAWPEPSCVKEADLRMLVTEAKLLLGTPPQKWAITALPYEESLMPVGPEEAERLFLAAFKRYGGQG